MIKHIRPKNTTPIIGGKIVRKMAKKAKSRTKKTKKEAKIRLRSISEQVKGTKEHDKESFDAPRITTETVAEHREEVLSKARRFIYPLQSRKRVAFISLSIIIGVLGLIIVSTGILLYGFKSTGGFAYNISRFVPFPVARVDGEFVSYENYLFELRNTLHYLSNFAQEGIEIDTEEGQALVKDTKLKILEKIQRDALAAQLARDAGIKITNAEIDEQVKLFEVRGGIDQSEGTLESVLTKYYNWDVDDLRRVVKNQLVHQKLLPVVDNTANEKISTAQSKLAEGVRFGQVAREFSDDQATSDNGGNIGTIDRNDRSLLPISIEAIFALKAGQVSEPIVLPNGYYLYRANEIVDENKIDVSHILIRFIDIEEFLADKLDHVAHRAYITI
jgi:hypothetical protein